MPVGRRPVLLGLFGALGGAAFASTGYALTPTLARVSEREADLVGFWRTHNNSPILVLDDDGSGYEMTAPAGVVESAMRSHGYTPAEPNSLVIPLSKAKTAEDQFRLLQDFARAHYCVSLVWDEAQPITRSDVVNIYCGLIAFGTYPEELFRAINDENPDALTFTFRRDISSHCSPTALGCIRSSDGSAEIAAPSDEGISAQVTEFMTHELAHIIENALLPDLADSLHALDPESFELVSFEDYLQDPFVNPQPEAVVNAYGRVTTETGSTLFEHLTIADFNSFTGWETSELEGGGSVRVQKMARLAVALADALDSGGSKPRDFLGYLKSTFIGDQRQSRAAERTEFSDSALCQVSAQYIQQQMRPIAGRNSSFRSEDGRAVDVAFERPGLLSLHPGRRSLRFNRQESRPDIDLLRSNSDLEMIAANVVSWNVDSGNPRLDVVLRLKWDDQRDMVISANDDLAGRLTLKEVGVDQPALTLN